MTEEQEKNRMLWCLWKSTQRAVAQIEKFKVLAKVIFEHLDHRK